MQNVCWDLTAENLIPTTDCGVKSYTRHFHRMGIYLSVYRAPRPIPTCAR